MLVDCRGDLGGYLGDEIQDSQGGTEAGGEGAPACQLENLRSGFEKGEGEEGSCSARAGPGESEQPSADGRRVSAEMSKLERWTGKHPQDPPLPSPQTGHPSPETQCPSLETGRLPARQPPPTPRPATSPTKRPGAPPRRPGAPPQRPGAPRPDQVPPAETERPPTQDPAPLPGDLATPPRPSLSLGMAGIAEFLPASSPLGLPVCVPSLALLPQLACVGTVALLP
ncbi:unnamed protein product [Rangifer tarandus platyrhynchus]|uniref:Uncharacterized protein n=1 Tax=Rangifer tarandus platyrhynchus TaxID=3082113 RepID=A0AC60A9J6_RANTA